MEQLKGDRVGPAQACFGEHPTSLDGMRRIQEHLDTVDREMKPILHFLAWQTKVVGHGMCRGGEEKAVSSS